MNNSWPGGVRKALYQRQHDEWNASHYPGTRQVCTLCDSPTGRCEEDAIYIEDDVGPICEECYSLHNTQQINNASQGPALIDRNVGRNWQPE